MRDTHHSPNVVHLKMTKGIIRFTVIFILICACNPGGEKRLTDFNNQLELSAHGIVLYDNSGVENRLSTISFGIPSSVNKDSVISYLVVWEKLQTDSTDVQNFISDVSDLVDCKPQSVRVKKTGRSEMVRTNLEFIDSTSTNIYELRQTYLNTQNKEGTVIFTVTSPKGYFGQKDSLEFERIMSSLKRK